jgi:hypothetical protein
MDGSNGEMNMNRFLAFALACLSTAVLTKAADDGLLDTSRIEQITGIKGSLNREEGVFKLSIARADLPVTVDGWKMPPFMGLTS